MHNYWLGGIYAIIWILNSKDLEWSLNTLILIDSCLKV